MASERSVEASAALHKSPVLRLLPQHAATPDSPLAIVASSTAHPANHSAVVTLLDVLTLLEAREPHICLPARHLPPPPTPLARAHHGQHQAIDHAGSRPIGHNAPQALAVRAALRLARHRRLLQHNAPSRRHARRAAPARLPVTAPEEVG